jgi:hypothetical protein
MVIDQGSDEQQELDDYRDRAASRRPDPANSLLHDLPFSAMLLLTLAGVAFHMPVGYWVLLTPVFGVVCVIDDIFSEI